MRRKGWNAWVSADTKVPSALVCGYFRELDAQVLHNDSHLADGAGKCMRVFLGHRAQHMHTYVPLHTKELIDWRFSLLKWVYVNDGSGRLMPT